MKKLLLATLLTIVGISLFATEPITGLTAVCVGAKIKLSASVSGGKWGASNPATATIDQNGTVTGVATGTVLITYSFNGNNSLFAVNVYPRGSEISGPADLCVGAKTSLSSMPGGTWSSNNVKVASVDEFSGEVTGVAKGKIPITYSFGGSCITTHNIVVDTCTSKTRKRN